MDEISDETEFLYKKLFYNEYSNRFELFPITKTIWVTLDIGHLKLEID